ncbi:hypothetical protein QBC38DRAFT_358136 [Podospora fimiseda]|uniref:RRM domain-containing protein n=1 Tax=Podospora fimiseda TaxID=252190 RepID=A0AAN7BUQ3_9PEZI|nr:hypothetical protein QBC38DRAFT_358136 [Podospora fimiseda]
MEEEETSGKSNRFICFIGNLPFTATSDSLKEHFSSLQPTSVRLLTDKDTGKSRGIAFVEFPGYDRMKTCLEKFHHTEFEGRKINVELTAGGGGKTKQRTEKIREKNAKLNEERANRMKKEEAAKLEKAKAKGGENGEQQQQQENNNGGIHPSRLAMMGNDDSNEQDNFGYDGPRRGGRGGRGGGRGGRGRGAGRGRGGGGGGRGGGNKFNKAKGSGANSGELTNRRF